MDVLLWRGCVEGDFVIHCHKCGKDYEWYDGEEYECYECLDKEREEEE